MGRIGLVWRRMKFFHADVMLLAVDCFRRNRPNDVEVTLLGAGASFESKWIRLADLKGNLFSYPETDEQYPTLWSQQRAVLLQLLSNPDPQMQSILAHPENMALIKRMIGLEEFVIPDEESRTKQYREIAQLLTESPIIARSDASPGTPIPRSAPLGGAAAEVEGQGFSPDITTRANRDTSLPKAVAQPSAQRHAVDVPPSPTPGDFALDIILPSIMPDEFADNHSTELEICMRWFSSDAGQVAKIESPAGYANVRAHAMFHREYLQKQQRQAQQGTGMPPAVPPSPPRSS
jgi:hypothetical protein